MYQTEFCYATLLINCFCWWVATSIEVVLRYGANDFIRFMKPANMNYKNFDA